MSKEAKQKALEKKKGKHEHKYVKGKCACGHEENVEYNFKKGGKETGKEDGD